MTTNYEISWDYKNNKMKPGKYLTGEGISYNINSHNFGLFNRIHSFETNFEERT